MLRGRAPVAQEGTRVAAGRPAAGGPVAAVAGEPLVVVIPVVEVGVVEAEAVAGVVADIRTD